MASVIKSFGAGPAGDVATLSLADFGRANEGPLESARRQASDILAAAEQEAIAIRQRAVEQGRAEAMAAADALLEEKVGRRIANLEHAITSAVDAIAQAKAEWLVHWEQAAVRVATAIAARVIRREVAQAPEITLTLVGEALELAAGAGNAQLRMHPDDLATLGSQVTAITDGLSRLGTTEVLADPHIERGGCRVDTRFGSIDQQFAAQLARIEQELA
jgi:flagellar biosynthesis/type III secretory pathway protein FliH